MSGIHKAELAIMGVVLIYAICLHLLARGWNKAAKKHYEE